MLNCININSVIMKKISFVILCLILSFKNNAQLRSPLFVPNNLPNNENIYTVKKLFLEKILHNPNDKNTDGKDNDLAKFNRWFHFVEPRCYPSGNLPRPDVLLREYEKQRDNRSRSQRTTSATAWQPVGPINVPAGYNGIGRVNCVVIDPLDTNTLYIGTACGGMWVSHNGGSTWTTTTDNFPSLSIADIAVNPNHTDTLYVATGDKYGSVAYGQGIDNIFFGGLYSAGVMKSTDGGATWHTTGLSYIQSGRDIIQQLLIQPKNPNILVAATNAGIYRTADAGNTWSLVCNSNVYNMVFRPFRSDTIYAVNDTTLIASYDQGITWNTLNVINSTFGGGLGDRCSIAVSANEPDAICIMDNNTDILISHDDGNTFLSPVSSGISSQGYYDHVLGVSPGNSSNICAGGVNMMQSLDAGISWIELFGYTAITPTTPHVDNHAIAFNPLRPNTFFVGNDGGIWKTTDNGVTWADLSNGLMISQIYYMSSSRQNPYIILCGLQDNATFYDNGTDWVLSNGPFGDGMDCAIFPGNDSIQIASTQDGNFGLSTDKGSTFNTYNLSPAFWTAPVVFNPFHSDTIYFGTTEVYVSNDLLTTANPLTSGAFPYGAVSLAISPSNPRVLYAADYSHIIRTTDAGNTWTDVTGPVFSDSLPITRMAVDYNDPMTVYVTVSGYHNGQKVYKSTTGGTSWTNISGTLPNIPVNCVAVDSSVFGAVFVGTDMGVYYQDWSTGGWELYNTGLPNVVVNTVEVNYTNRKIRAATYGRGVWESDLRPSTTLVHDVTIADAYVQLYPNPSSSQWKIMFSKQKPTNYSVTVSDIAGNKVNSLENPDFIDASKLPCGVYNIEISTGISLYDLKAVKE